jgi:uncharacterized tellurite resistance protein B-like protein
MGADGQSLRIGLTLNLPLPVSVLRICAGRVNIMAGVSNSRFALYEGLIGLAWADHVLHDSEREALHELIDGNRFFSDEQRAELHARIDTREELSTIWTRITEPQDRARLIDWANTIFGADGEFADVEKTLLARKRAKHLETLDMPAIRDAFNALRAEQEESDAANDAAMAAYRERYSLLRQASHFVRSRFGKRAS